MFERELTVMQGERANERVTAVEVSFPANDPQGRENYLELRFEHEVGELGWVVQRRIPIAAQNMCQLRAALNLFCGANANSSCNQAKVVNFGEYVARSA